MNCPKCNTPIADPNQKFCIRCGANVQGLSALARPACPNCRTPIDGPDQKFCIKCGSNIQGIFAAVNAPHPMAPVPPSLSKGPACPKCTTPIDSPDQKFCIKCGNNIQGVFAAAGAPQPMAQPITVAPPAPTRPICPKCSTPIDSPDQKFCIKCGNNIQGVFAAAGAPQPIAQPITVAPPAPAKPICPKCSMPIDSPDQKFCIKCGNNIQGIFAAAGAPRQITPVTPVPPSAPTRPVCPKCGTPIENEGHKFCIKCGNNIQSMLSASPIAQSSPAPAPIPPPVTPEAICPKCKTVIENASQKFCINCGNNIQGIFTGAATPVQSAAPPDPSVPVKEKVLTTFCRNCRHELVGTPEVCMNCGARPLAGRTYCNACGSQVSELAIICVKCGTRFRE
jgi:predicted amidophosphoribosyltransferase